MRTHVSFAFLILSLLGFSARAANWRLQGLDVEQKRMDRLSSKYENIQTPEDLQNLIRELSSATPISKLEVTNQDGTWVIVANPAQRIVRIDLELVTRTFRSAIDATTQQFLGHVDSPRSRARIVSLTKNLLARRGYQTAKVALHLDFLNPGVAYTLDVDYGQPCLIRSAKTEFNLPPGITLDIEPGDICDQEVMREQIDSLLEDVREAGYEQVQIEDVKYEYLADTNTMNVLVPGSLGKRIDFEFVDENQVFFLGDLFEDDEIEDLDPAIVGPEAIAAEIREKYRSRGFDDVEVVGPKIVHRGGDKYTYRYTIIPGPRYEVSSLEFQGNSVFSREELLEFLGFSGLWQTSTTLNLAELERGIDNLKAKYRELGYWDIEIPEPRLTKNPKDGRAQLVIILEEGLRRRLENVILIGNEHISREEAEELLTIKSGEAFDQVELVTFEKDLRNLYINRGYLYASIDLNLKFRQGVRTVFVTVTATVLEGPRVKIGDIQIRGLVNTDPKVVARELLFETGDWYDPEQVDLSRRAILSLGIFRSVQIMPLDRNAVSERSPTLDMAIEVREARPGNVSFGPGWSLFRGNRFGVESSYNNLWGTGRQIYGRARMSEEAHQEAIGDKTLIGRTVSVGYLEPYILNLPVNGTASATTSARANDKWLLTQSGEVALVHNFRHFMFGSKLALFYGQKINKEESSDEQREGYLKLLGGDTRSGRLGLRYNWDYRNDITWPTSGFILKAEVSRADYWMGGDLAYKNWNLGYSHYFNLIEGIVLAVGANFESFIDVQRRGQEADALPQSETLYVGGADTVRGYRERSLGPIIAFDITDEDGNVVQDEFGNNSRNRDDRLGGSHSAVYKVELRKQIIAKTLALTLFTDAGNVFFAQNEVDSFNRKESEATADDDKNPAEIEDNEPYFLEEVPSKPEYIWSKNYTAYGVALSYLTPLGSVNLSYGLPWKRCAREVAGCNKRGKEEDHWLLNGHFHLNVGANF